METAALKVFGSPITSAPTIRWYNEEDVKSIARRYSTRQEVVNPKLIKFFEQLKVEGNDPAILDEMTREAERGLCLGYSICFNSMSSQGKRDWWFQVLAIIARWDGKASSLRDVYELPGRKPVRLRELLERASHYLLYHQKHFFKLQQKKILAPEHPEDFAYYERAGVTPKKGEVRSIERIVDVKVLHHTRFDLASLHKALDKAGIEGNEVLLEGDVALPPPHLRGYHAIAISYEGGQWCFYNSSDKYVLCKNKAELLRRIERTFIAVHHVFISGIHAPVRLTERQAKFAEFSHLLECWQHGVFADYAHSYLEQYEQIKAQIISEPKKVEAFFHSAVATSPVKNLSLQQRMTMVWCLTKLPMPTRETQKLLETLFTEKTIHGESLLSRLLRTYPDNFLAVSKAIMAHPSFGPEFYYQVLRKEGINPLDPLTRRYPKIMEAFTHEFATALTRDNPADALNKHRYIEKMRALSPVYFAPESLTAKFAAIPVLRTPVKPGMQRSVPPAPVKRGLRLLAEFDGVDPFPARASREPMVFPEVIPDVARVTVRSAEPVAVTVPVPPSGPKPRGAFAFGGRYLKLPAEVKGFVAKLRGKVGVAAGETAASHGLG